MIVVTAAEWKQCMRMSNRGLGESDWSGMEWSAQLTNNPFLLGAVTESKKLWKLWIKYTRFLPSTNFWGGCESSSVWPRCFVNLEMAYYLPLGTFPNRCLWADYNKNLKFVKLGCMSRVRTDAKLILSIQSHITLLSPQKYFNKWLKLWKYNMATRQITFLFYLLFKPFNLEPWITEGKIISSTETIFSWMSRYFSYQQPVKKIYLLSISV